jgi:hypothetical protein
MGTPEGHPQLQRGWTFDLEGNLVSYHPRDHVEGPRIRQALQIQVVYLLDLYAELLNYLTGSIAKN